MAIPIPPVYKQKMGKDVKMSFLSTSIELVEYLLFPKKQRGKVIYFRNKM